MKEREFLADHGNIEILRLLQKDPRISISDIARTIGMSNPAVKERIVRLESSGVIAGYSVQLDPKKLGHSITAFVRIRPLPGHLPQIAELARNMPQVAECHRITGEDCFILKVYIPEIASLDQVLDQFLAHGQTTTSIVQSSPVLFRSPPLPKTAGREPSARKSKQRSAKSRSR